VLINPDPALKRVILINFAIVQQYPKLGVQRQSEQNGDKYDRGLLGQIAEGKIWGRSMPHILFCLDADDHECFGSDARPEHHLLFQVGQSSGSPGVFCAEASEGVSLGSPKLVRAFS
jgi:hypothetical protein